VGAGFAGAVFARVMAEAGRKVLVIERRPVPGGNMADKRTGGIVVHYLRAAYLSHQSSKRL
jgi:UDP-galactopyranose mutase